MSASQLAMRGAHGNLEGRSELEEHIFAGKTLLSVAICLVSGESVDIMRWHLPSAGHWPASVCAHSKLLLDFCCYCLGLLKTTGNLEITTLMQNF